MVVHKAAKEAIVGVPFRQDEPGWAGMLEVVEVELGSASEN